MRRTNLCKISLNKKWCLRRWKYESLQGKDRVILCSRGAMRLLLFPKDLILPHCQKRKWCSYCSVFSVHWASYLDTGMSGELEFG